MPKAARPGLLGCRKIMSYNDFVFIIFVCNDGWDYAVYWYQYITWRKRDEIMARKGIKRVARDSALNYIKVKALREHFKLSWADVDRITEEWKKANPKPDKKPSAGEQ